MLLTKLVRCPASSHLSVHTIINRSLRRHSQSDLTVMWICGRGFLAWHTLRRVYWVSNLFFFYQHGEYIHYRCNRLHLYNYKESTICKQYDLCSINSEFWLPAKLLLVIWHNLHIFKPSRQTSIPEPQQLAAVCVFLFDICIKSRTAKTCVALGRSQHFLWYAVNPIIHRTSVKLNFNKNKLKMLAPHQWTCTMWVMKSQANQFFRTVCFKS